MKKTAVFTALCALCNASAQAQITIDATDRGNYTDAGAHTASSVNYSTGKQTSPDTYLRSWYVFSVPESGVDYASATLSLFNPSNGYRSSDADETLGFFAVTTDISTLRAGGTGLTGIYGDLGDGTSFGTKTVTSADNAVPNGSFVQISLNSDFLTYVNDHRGEDIAIGASLLSVQGNFNYQERFFAGTDGGPLSNTQLILTAVPEPGEYAAMFAAGLIGVAVWRRRQMQNSGASA